MPESPANDSGGWRENRGLYGSSMLDVASCESNGDARICIASKSSTSVFTLPERPGPRRSPEQTDRFWLPDIGNQCVPVAEIKENVLCNAYTLRKADYRN